MCQFIKVPEVLFVILLFRFAIVHFKVVCSVTWPLNRNEAGVGLVLIQNPPWLSRANVD